MANTFVVDTTKSRGEFPGMQSRKVIVGTLTIGDASGATAGDIPASLFGLTQIESADPLVKSDNTLIVTVAPAVNGLSLLGKAAATAAPANIPTAAYIATIRGW